MQTAREIAKEIAANFSCNCDLDNWEPEASTGHSCVCQIHKMAMERFRYPRPDEPEISSPAAIDPIQATESDAARKDKE